MASRFMNAARLRAKLFGHGQRHRPKDLPEYKPKFCRTRGCNLHYGHDIGEHPTRHSGPQRQPLAVGVPHGTGGRRYRRAARRAAGASGQFSHYPGPRMSPRTTPVSGAALHMDEIRRASKTPRKIEHAK